MTKLSHLTCAVSTSALSFTFVLHLTVPCLLLLIPLSYTMTSQPQAYHDYCIVGAGPAGLQMGYFFKKNNRDYIIFERGNTTGNFFTLYPRHRKLISINKRHTGKTNKEFNLRHDWNSLLSDDESLLFRHYSKEMFPSADTLIQYLQDYRKRLGIKVQFNTEVRNIRSSQNDSVADGVVYLLDDQLGNTYMCQVLIVATGIWKPHIPEMQGIEYAQGYESMSVDPEEYEGKSVLILGRGNSAFEVADGIYGVTNHIHMLARSRLRLSWATHYVGDLRAINNNLLDTYQLKSLDGLIEAGITEVKLVKKGNKFSFAPLTDSKEDTELFYDNFALREPYDKVIRCLGFTFDTSLFENGTLLRGRGRIKKYPAIKYNYEAVRMPALFFAGTVTHSLDFRKSAGGFIHGFRYTAQVLSQLLEYRYHGVPWHFTRIPTTQLLNMLLKRMNEASGLYQMFQVLGDVAVFSDDGNSVDYFEGFPIKLLHGFTKHTGAPASRILVALMEYGPDFSGPGKDTFRPDRATGEPAKAHQSNFLHPVFYYYHQLPTMEQMTRLSSGEALPRPTAVHHLVEDFLTSWDAPLSHIMPLRHFLDHITGKDLRLRFAQSCFVESMTHDRVGPSCTDQYLQGRGLGATLSMAQIVLKDTVLDKQLE